jgi:hypothetical protein
MVSENLQSQRHYRDNKPGIWPGLRQVVKGFCHPVILVSQVNEFISDRFTMQPDCPGIGILTENDASESGKLPDSLYCLSPFFFLSGDLDGSSPGTAPG